MLTQSKIAAKESLVDGDDAIAVRQIGQFVVKIFCGASLHATSRSRSRAFEYHNDERARGRSEERTNKGERISKIRGKPGEYIRVGSICRYITVSLFIIKKRIVDTRSRSSINARIIGCNFEKSTLRRPTQ